MIRAIVFDWGGIFTEGTFDSSATQAIAASFGRDLADVERVYFPLMEHFEVGEMTPADFHREITAALDVAMDRTTFKNLFLGAVRERRSMYDLLASIPERYRIGMLSNNVAELCDTVRDDPRCQPIRTFVFSNEIGVRKPNVAAFEELERAMGVPRSETVFVDDAPVNVAAAAAFGLQPLLLDDVDSFAVRWNATFPDVPFPTSSRLTASASDDVSST